MCGEEPETIEHVFFQCFFSRRLWRASYLGFDFETGTPVPFEEWLAEECAKQGRNLGFHFCLVDLYMVY